MWGGQGVEGDGDRWAVFLKLICPGNPSFLQARKVTLLRGQPKALPIAPTKTLEASNP